MTSDFRGGPENRPQASVSFTDPAEPPEQEATSGPSALATELFGEIQTAPTISSWNPLVLHSIQSESRSGLREEVRSKLLAKHEVKGDLMMLAPPKLNKELVSALPPSVLKRDEYQSLAQAQVGACLNALGTGISMLLEPKIVQNFPDEARSAVSFLSDGMHMLADHHFRLSLARRAFTKPSLNILGRNAAETAPIDEFLFGQNFIETLKAAQMCEKAGREVTKASAPLGKSSLQPARQQTTQRRIQPQAVSKPQDRGNRKAPARTGSARQTGAPYHKSRRSQSRPLSRRQP